VVDGVWRRVWWGWLESWDRWCGGDSCGYLRFFGDFFGDGFWGEGIFGVSFFVGAFFAGGFLLRLFSSSFSLRYSFVVLEMISPSVSLCFSTIRGRTSLSILFAYSMTIWVMFSSAFSMRMMRRLSVLASSCSISGETFLFFG